MANNYFQFKQFIIHQEKAALKLSTDSCLFGAWAASYLSTANHQLSTVLDIGAGTGILMLMLAQKTTVLIDGIEMDIPSYEQAKDNLASSPWKGKLNLINDDVKKYSFKKKYDFIISNPPFYEGDLKSAHAYKNVAKHDVGLTLEELVGVIDNNLEQNGNFAVLLPFHRAGNFITLAAKKNFYCARQVNVKQTPTHHYFRTMFLFSRNQSENVTGEIVIKGNDGIYSAAFTGLLKDYYLYL